MSTARERSEMNVDASLVHVSSVSSSSESEPKKFIFSCVREIVLISATIWDLTLVDLSMRLCSMLNVESCLVVWPVGPRPLLY